MKAFAHRGVVRRASISVASIAVAVLLHASALAAQHSPEQSSLDLWIVQRYRGAQLLPDSGARSLGTLAHAGAPRIEAARTATRRDTLVAVHFGPSMWRSTITTATEVQLADPSGTVSGIAGKITARRVFRAPRTAGARDTVQEEWRIGWAYLVAIPSRTANASTSGFGGWALAETPDKRTVKVVKPMIGSLHEKTRSNSSAMPPNASPTATQSTPSAALPSIR